MNHLIAKVKDRNNKYRKVKSGDVYYNEQNTDDHIKYNPRTILEEEQWFVINEFGQKEYCPELLNEKWDSTDYDLIKRIEIESIDYLCAYQNENCYCFQRIYKNARYLKRNYLSIGDNIKFARNANIITLNNEPDAIYRKSEDSLYFKKLETIAPIFKGIDCLYKEATDVEVSEFLNQDFIYIGGEYGIKRVGKANRKRLSLVAEKLSVMNKREKAEVLAYTKEYFPELSNDGKRFSINSEEDLKKLIFGIEERLYTTPVTKEQRAANSIIAL